jgi:hypothetical protein
MQLLFEITLSDWTPTNPNPAYKYVKLWLMEGKIVMTQFVRQNTFKKRLPDRILSNYLFTPLELGMLKQQLDTIKKFTKTFVISLPSLGLEYELEKSVRSFETFLQKYKSETGEIFTRVYTNVATQLKGEIENYQRELAQLWRNYNVYKAEFNEFVMEHYNESLQARYNDLLVRNKELEDMFEKERFEKEQFIAYCNNLNEKIMVLTDE